MFSARIKIQYPLSELCFLEGRHLLNGRNAYVFSERRNILCFYRLITVDLTTQRYYLIKQEELSFAKSCV